MLHNPEDLFAGNGEMTALMRAKDWSHSALGPASTWPQSLRTAFSICLQSRFPMLIWWGPELIMLYNDAYRVILGAKHPEALGSAGRTVWPEIWDVIGPMLDGVLHEGRSTWSENQMLIVHRHGYAEECYFTFSYSPIRDESGGIGGIFTAVYETTEQVLAARRLVTLRDLAARAAEATTTGQACAGTMSVLAQNAADVPLAHLFLRDGDALQLVATTAANAPALGEATTARIRQAGAARPSVVPASEIGDLVAGGSVDETMVLPLMGTAAEPYGYLLAGVSRKRALDSGYRSFFDLVAGHIATAIADARAREDEQRRLDALAELDRVKTAFFSNISHEFRTPLTLMLGPLEDMLDEAGAEVPEPFRAQIALVHRQSLRLLKLVNTLLDFSRLEAGRVRARYVVTDVGAFTAELASMFRPVTEKAGLKLTIDCDTIDAPAYVDRDMWEKIVLNLLSNAFKFTLQGEITTRVRRAGNTLELSVTDTGSGVPAAELPNLFARFHRVEGTRRRTHEGSGIGLALVAELAHLHGGSARVDSVEGEGSTFTVSIPLGADHLPQDQVARAISPASTPSSAPRLFLEEAMQWLAREEKTETPAPDAAPAAGTKPRILLVDDNSDLRNYVRRLLEPQHEVTAVADGAEALEVAVLMKPDLVLSDVMMPNMDGFALLSALRSRPATAGIPVILLSARAGEEARVEGLAAGADDYVTKPFSARELQTRVSNLLALARVRRDAQAAIRASEERYRSLVEASASIVWRRVDGEGVSLAQWQAFTGQTVDEVQNGGWIDAIHPDDRALTTERWRRAVDEGHAFEVEHRLRRHDGEYRHMLVRAIPISDADGHVREWIGVDTDVTTERRLQQTLENERLTLRDVFMRAPAFVATLRGPDHVFEVANPMYMQLVGQERDIIGKSVREAFPDLQGQGFFELLDSVYSSGQPFSGNELRVLLQRANGKSQERFLDFVYQPTRTPDGVVDGIFVHGVDVTEKVLARQQVESQAAELDRVNRAKDDFLATLSHELRTPLTAILGWSHMLRLGLTDEETTRVAFDTIDRSAHIQAQLIDDVLDLSRIVTGKVRIEAEMVDVADVASKALDGVRLAATARGVELAVRLDDGLEPPLILGDASRLQQVIWNLLTNAIKFTPEGGRISVTVRRSGAVVTISVSDTGIGIAPDFLPYVFEPFRQAERTTTRVHGGLGLGLAIVRHMVHLHGGTITAASEGEGRGATFTIDLPTARGAAAAADRARFKSGAPDDLVDRDFADLHGTSVLVIDDDASVSDMLAAVLRHCGATVETASSVRLGIRAIQSDLPDVIVCDIAMPSEDGFDFARWLAESPAARNIPLVAVTAFGRPDDERRTLDAGFTRYIRKPIEPANLSRTIAGLARRVE